MQINRCNGFSPYLLSFLHICLHSNNNTSTTITTTTTTTTTTITTATTATTATIATTTTSATAATASHKSQHEDSSRLRRRRCSLLHPGSSRARHRSNREH